MKVVTAFLLLTGVSSRQQSKDNVSLRGRLLGPGAPKLTKTEWKECVGMAAGDCATLVRREAKRHEISNLSVKVVAPRTAAEIQSTYMKVGIAVNVFDQVTGDKNDGIITYPFIWVSAEDGKTRELGPWDCSGMDAWSCCRQVRLSVPDMDIHGNHIECFAHENSLVPETRTDRPVYEAENLAYFTFVYNTASEKFEKAIVPPAQVQQLRQQKNATVASGISSLDSALQQDKMTVSDLISLEKDLITVTDSIGDAQNLLGNIENLIETVTMGADIAKLEHPTTPQQQQLAAVEIPVKESTLEEIMLAVRHKMYDYASNNMVLADYVWIYASHNGKVWRAPKIGGTFDGHEEYLKDVPGYEDYKLRYVSNVTKAGGSGARFLQWAEIDV